MSITGISGNMSDEYVPVTKSILQLNLQQLGQAIQSGNLSSAQSDFASLQAAFSQSATATGSTSTASTDNPVAQAFSQLGSDLQSGNLSAAQKDYSTIQQDLQNDSSTSHSHHHHHLSSGSSASSSQSSLLQDPNQIGQGLTSNNLSSAQQAYAALAQQLQQFALGSEDSSQLSNLPVSLVA
jgi:hypothetical protein